jgi:hypothetical protein
MIKVAAFTSFSLALLAQPFVADDPVVHVLIQFPLLGLAGFLVGSQYTIGSNWWGPAIVLALVVTIIWMLPRSVDAALTDTTWHVAKFLTLPLLVGLPLGMVWRHIGPIVRGFIKAEAVSMLLFLGFLYTHAPIRLCNSYLADDQVRLGFGFAYVAGGLALLWVVPILFAPEPTQKRQPA